MTTDYYARAMLKIRAKKAGRNQKDSRSRATRAGRLYQPAAETSEPIRRRRERKTGHRPFVGTDGEGGGRDDKGRQLFRLLRAGEQVLFHDNRPLSTIDCLDFLLSLSPRPIYVSFAFGYDTTMILRDLPKDRLDRLFSEQRGYTHWRNYGIDWLPGHYLRVCRVAEAWDGAKWRSVPVKGTSRTIYETFGFFQTSFVKALETWDVGTAEDRDRMAATKDDRCSFGLMTPELIEYNRQECDWLAELMEKFRDRCQQVDLVPGTWNGPGKIASALLKKHNVIRAAEVVRIVPAEVLEAGRYAYYGGRAETSWVGYMPECWAYDLRSAYPAAMLDLPCLEHATWEKVDAEAAAKLTEADLFLADVDYAHPRETVWGGLPHRHQSGGLLWPYRGAGTYWSPEIFAAIRSGTRIKFNHAWVCHRNCSCRPMAWVKDLYQQRKALERIAKGLGIPIKLALNSLYGKFAQRVGKAPYQNHLWAGLITAIARARMLDAIGTAPRPADALMVATDAVLCRRPLPVDTADELGNWEETELGPMFIAKPGVYWQTSGDPELNKVKSRGMDHKAVRTQRDDIEACWHRYSHRLRQMPLEPALPGHKTGLQPPHPFPSLTIEMGGFLGLRLAWAMGKPELAGTWAEAGSEASERKIFFDWTSKRHGNWIAEIAAGPAGLAIRTLPRDSSKRRSARWEPLPDTRQAQLADWANWWATSQPDYVSPDDPLLRAAREE